MNIARYKSQQINDSEDDYSGMKHGTNQRKPSIYSPNVNSQEIKSPTIFPPPNLIDRKVSVGSGRDNSIKLTNEEKQKSTSPKDLKNESENRRFSNGKPSIKKKRIPKKYSLINKSIPKYEEEINQNKKNNASTEIVSKDSVLKSKTKRNTGKRNNPIQSEPLEKEVEPKTKGIDKNAGNNSNRKKNGNEPSHQKSTVKEDFNEWSLLSNPDSSPREYLESAKDTLQDIKLSKESNKYKKVEKERRSEDLLNVLPQEELPINKEDREESFNNVMPLQTKKDSLKSKKKLVKLPVLLTKVDFDLDIHRSIQTVLPIERIDNMDWSLESLSTNVILPSNTVFFKGVLIADIEYVDAQTKKIHKRKYPIAWQKVVQVDWLTLPEVGSDLRKEYTFHSGYQDFNTHYEFFQSFTEELEDELKSIRFIWHNRLEKQPISSAINIQGTVALSINLLQKQYTNV